MMSDPFHDIIRQHSTPLQPLPTQMDPHLPAQKGLRAVLLDVYGTMFVSASGEVGTMAEQDQQKALAAALEAVGLAGLVDAGEGLMAFRGEIDARHHQLRGEGIDYPEIDVVDVWQFVVDLLTDPDDCTAATDLVNGRRLALEYEVRVNPVWPMPRLTECLGDLRRAGLRLGIVSNAQFYTPELFPALLGRPVEAWGFEPELQFYSYNYRRAKPDEFLYHQARDCLASRGVRPDETLYVGNDMLNDIQPAAACGFRTALFAGDSRSLRRREGDPRVAGVTPDLVLTELTQLTQLI